jgi:hypothetical protein
MIPSVFNECLLSKLVWLPLPSFLVAVQFLEGNNQAFQPYSIRWWWYPDTCCCSCCFYHQGVLTSNFLLLNKKFYIEVPQILCLKSSDQDCLVLIIQKQYLMSSSGIVLPPHFWLVLVLRDPWGLHQAWIGHLSFGFLSNGSFLHDYNQIVLLCFSMAAV